MGGKWAVLFSGGKDSSWTLYRTLASDRNVVRTVTARPAGDSYLFHTEATELPALLSESAGIPHSSFPVELDTADDLDSSARGDAELAVLERAIDAVNDEVQGGLDGLTAGAVQSRFQADRIERLCERRGLATWMPLWDASPRETLLAMIDAGFDIRVVAVGAAGLDETWLSRRIDHEAVSELLELESCRGVHPMGEGGEYETLVVDGPHLTRPLRFEATPVWDGTRGRLEITDAWLGSEP